MKIGVDVNGALQYSGENMPVTQQDNLRENANSMCEALYSAWLFSVSAGRNPFMWDKLAAKQVPAVLRGHDELSACLNTATLRSVYLHGVTRSQAVHLLLLLPYPVSSTLIRAPLCSSQPPYPKFVH
jgi:hypothetical protein